MSEYLYSFSIHLLRLLFIIAFPFSAKARQFVLGRWKIFPRLKSSFLKNESTQLVWVHCASLGEFEQGRPIIESLKEKIPNVKILLTFFSPSGYEVRKNYSHADYVYYLPWDTPSQAKKFVAITKPSLAIFIKYEF